MATITIKLTQAALDARSIATGLGAEDAGTVSGALNSVLTIYDTINENYYQFSGVSASATKVVYRFYDGASVTLNGSLDYPSLGYGNATITKSSFLLPGKFSAESSGSTRAYFYSNGGYYTTSGVVNKATFSVLDANASMLGKVTASISGAIYIDSSKNLSGTIDRISTAASKLLKASEIVGSFSIDAGNSSSPTGYYSGGVIGKYASVSGTLTKYSEKFYDGSIILIDLSGSPISLSNDESVSMAQLSDPSNLPGNDQLDIALPATLSLPQTLSTGAGNDSIRLAGGGSYLHVDAGDGDDSITLVDGNHSCMGGAGNDTLVSGKGNDTLLGGAGNDSYTVNGANDVIDEATSRGGTEDAGGTDLVSSASTFVLGSFIENLVLTGKNAVNGTGNSLANLLTGNGAANVLDGGAGDDTLLGGAGNDTYVVDSEGDRVYETRSMGATQDATGKDIVLASASHWLGDFVEDLTLTGSGAISGTGNGLANKITGNDAANRLAGGAGKDSLIGGAGADTLAGEAGTDLLTGGAGADVFLFSALSELGLGKTRDVITDFVSGVDKIDLSAIDALAASSGDQAFSRVTSFSTAGAELRFAVVSGQGILYLNTDQDSAAEFEIQLNGVTSLDTADLIL